jgi:hypothetical protein
VQGKAYQVISGMSEAELNTLILRLTKYSLGVSRNLDWRTQNPHELPGGETIDSIVSKALAKVLSGERNWNPDQDPSLAKYLMDVIDSLLSHLAVSSDNTSFTFIPEQTRDTSVEEVKTGEGLGGAEWLNQPARNPEELLLARELEERNEKALGTLMCECENDPVLMKVLGAMFDGYSAPNAIAARLGIGVQEVYSANRRLDRKLALVRKKMSPAAALPVEKGNDVRH